jgi:ATP-dependent DNA ligase
VPHIVEELARHWPPNTVLLGELAFDDWTSTSTDVGSILRCKPGKAIARQTEKKLHFFIFDVLAYNGKDFVAAEYPFIERYKCYPEFNKNQLYYHHVLNDSGEHSNFTEFADFVWSKGGEGIMIVRKDMLYQPGKRTAWHTLKLKKKLGEITTTVLSTLEPTREYEGTEIDSWKYFTIDDNNNKTAVTKPYYFGWKNGVVVDYNGVQVKVTSGLTDLDREYLAKKETQKLISEGKLKAIITGMSTTPDGSIRHPVLVRLV